MKKISTVAVENVPEACTRMVGAAADALTPYLPLLGLATAIINKLSIIKISSVLYMIEQNQPN